MRISLGTIASRLTLLAGIVLGAFSSTRHVTGSPLDAFTGAACLAHLPGSTARCESDRFVAHTGPFVVPALLGAAGGLVVAIVLVALVSGLLRAYDRPRRLASR